jgi:hypothetical protein
VTVQAQPDQVPGPQRHVRVELYLLRHVPDPGLVPAALAAEEELAR